MPYACFIAALEQRQQWPLLIPNNGEAGCTYSPRHFGGSRLNVLSVSKCKRYFSSGVIIIHGSQIYGSKTGCWQ